MGGVLTTHTGGQVGMAEYHWNYVENGHILKNSADPSMHMLGSTLVS
jgi:hypothetical protein